MNKLSLKSIIWTVIGILIVLFLVKVAIAIVPIILAFILVMWVIRKFKKVNKKTTYSNNYTKMNSEEYNNKDSEEYIDVDYEDIGK